MLSSSSKGIFLQLETKEFHQKKKLKTKEERFLPWPALVIDILSVDN